MTAPFLRDESSEKTLASGAVPHMSRSTVRRNQDEFASRNRRQVRVTTCATCPAERTIATPSAIGAYFPRAVPYRLFLQCPETCLFPLLSRVAQQTGSPAPMVCRSTVPREDTQIIINGSCNAPAAMATVLAGDGLDRLNRRHMSE